MKSLNLTEPEFRDACRQAFSYLITELDFKELPQSEDPYQFMVRFANSTTLVTVVGGSFGSTTDVYVDRAGALPDDNFIDRYGYNLRHLLKMRKIRCPIADSRTNFGCLVWFLSMFLPGERFRKHKEQCAQIPIYAKLLRDGAGDLLRGNLSVLPSIPRPLDPYKAGREALMRQ